MIVFKFFLSLQHTYASNDKCYFMVLDALNTHKSVGCISTENGPFLNGSLCRQRFDLQEKGFV